MARNSQRESESEELPAQDSFLDLVANIVGIMILLVVIVGIRAATSLPDENANRSSTEPVLSSAKLNTAMSKLRTVAQEGGEWASKAALATRRADELDLDRIALIGYVNEVERELAKRRDELTTPEQQEYDIQVAIATAEADFDELTRARLALESELDNVKTLRNVPTPVSRPVTEELRLWVSKGRVVAVPVDELVDLALSDIHRRRHIPNTLSSVGPLGGFVLHYAPVERTGVTPGGSAIRQGGLAGEVKPTSDRLGETIEEACAVDSQLREQLKKLNLGTTTITFWTSTDAFSDVAPLREMAAKLGFSTAIRPVAEGHYIAFAPWGTQTRAQ